MALNHLFALYKAAVRYDGNGISTAAKLLFGAIK